MGVSEVLLCPYCHLEDINLQESRAAAGNRAMPQLSVLFGRSTPTTFLTSIRLAIRKSRFRGTNMLAQNTI